MGQNPPFTLWEISFFIQEVPWRQHYKLCKWPRLLQAFILDLFADVLMLFCNYIIKTLVGSGVCIPLCWVFFVTVVSFCCCFIHFTTNNGSGSVAGVNRCSTAGNFTEITAKKTRKRVREEGMYNRWTDWGKRGWIFCGVDQSQLLCSASPQCIVTFLGSAHQATE